MIEGKIIQRSDIVMTCGHCGRRVGVPRHKSKFRPHICIGVSQTEKDWRLSNMRAKEKTS